MVRLDYEGPFGKDHIDWPPVLFIVCAGVPVGIAVPFAYTFALIAGLVGSAVVGCLAGYAARSDPYYYAFWGGAVVGATTTLTYVVGYWPRYSGIGDAFRAIFPAILIVPAIAGIPAVIGCAMVVLSGVRDW